MLALFFLVTMHCGGLILSFESNITENSETSRNFTQKEQVSPSCGSRGNDDASGIQAGYATC